MADTSYAKIKDYTKSIVVNGENWLRVELDWVELGSGSYDNELYIELGEKYHYQYLNTNENGGAGFVMSTVFCIPIDWLKEIPDLNVASGTIRVQTVDMNTGKIAYTSTKKFTVYVPEEYKPEISAINVNMVDVRNYSVDYALYGMTLPEVLAKVKAHSTSPIKKYYITGGGVNVSGDYSTSSDYGDYNFHAFGTALKVYAKTKFTLTVEDGRGRKASIISEEFYVQSYTRPLIKGLSAYRVDEDGIAQADGDKIKVTLNAGMSTIKNSNEENMNSLRCFVEYKKVTDNSYEGFEEITNNEPFIFDADPDYSYEIRCEVRDIYTSSEAFFNVLGNRFDINAHEEGGVGIGTKAEKGFFDVAYESRFQEGLSAEKTIESGQGLVSTGTGSKGDFLSFGEATRIETLWHYIGDDPANGIQVDSWGDFNDCTDIGLYAVYNNSDVSSSNHYKVDHAPCELAGTLRVYNGTGNANELTTGKYLIQEYVVYDGSATYRRCLSKIRDNYDVEWPESWTFGEWYCYSVQSDYVVDRGTENGWNYKKWNSGDLDLWAQVTVDNYGDSRHLKKHLSLPLNTLENPIVNITMKDGIAFAFRQGAVTSYSYNLSSKELIIVVLKDTGGVTQGSTADVSVDIKGKWK